MVKCILDNHTIVSMLIKDIDMKGAPADIVPAVESALKKVFVEGFDINVVYEDDFGVKRIIIVRENTEELVYDIKFSEDGKEELSKRYMSI